jgi:PPP family 3-phenylpropionic acid transporter
LLIGSVAAASLLLGLPVVAVAAIVASFTVFGSMYIALGDALAVVELPAPERQYGALRAHASLSFTVGIIAAGFLYDRAGYGASSWVFLAWSAAMFLLIGRVRDRTADSKVRHTVEAIGGERARRFGSLGRAFAVQPRLWAVLAAFTLAFAGLQGALTFIGIRIVDLGGQPSDVGLSFGLAALTEVPGLVGAGWLGRRIGLRWLCLLSLVSYGLCITSWGILPSPMAINATRFVTGLCFGSLIAARVLIVPRLLPEQLQATGQVLLQAATYGLGTVVGSVVGGVAYGWIGPTAFFAGAGVVSIVGGVATWLALAGPAGARLTGPTATPFELAELPASPL